MILNKAKDYYKNNKERLKEQARDKHRSLTEEEKNKKREYVKNRYHNMSEENKQRLKEYPKNYRKGKATDEHYTQNKEAIKEKSRERYKNLEEKDKINGRRRKRCQELV